MLSKTFASRFFRRGNVNNHQCLPAPFVGNKSEDSARWNSPGIFCPPPSQPRVQLVPNTKFHSFTRRCSSSKWVKIRSSGISCANQLNCSNNRTVSVAALSTRWICGAGRDDSTSRKVFMPAVLKHSTPGKSTNSRSSPVCAPSQKRSTDRQARHHANRRNTRKVPRDNQRTRARDNFHDRPAYAFPGRWRAMRGPKSSDGVSVQI